MKARLPVVVAVAAAGYLLKDPQEMRRVTFVMKGGMVYTDQTGPARPATAAAR